MSCSSRWSQVALLISILGVVVAAPWQGEQRGTVTRWASWGVTEHNGFQGVQLELRIFSTTKDLAFQMLFTLADQNNKKIRGYLVCILMFPMSRHFMILTMVI